MIRALVVDDEIYSTEGIKFALDWDSLGISQVYTANNIRQAKTILSEQPIQILISDIEMPKGSGYDLLRWMRDKDYDPAIIILTSYGKFEYAKQAIEFQCLDYLLKPVSKKILLEAVQRGIGRYFERRKTDANNKLAEYWNSGQKRRLRHFWRDVMDASAMVDSKALLELAEQSHIPYTRESVFLPVLYKFHSSDEQFSFRTWFDEFSHRLYFQVFQGSDSVLLPQEPSIWVIVQADMEDMDGYYKRTLQKSKAFTDWEYEEHELIISCYLGVFGDLVKTTEQLRQLQVASLENVSDQKGVFLLYQKESEIVYKRPDIESWIALFNKCDYKEAIREIELYIDQKAEKGEIDYGSLMQLLQDYMQAFYIALSEKNIQAHLLFNDEYSVALYEKADKSIRGFKEWICHLINKASDYISMASDANSVVWKIKQFIKENLSEQLSRKQISASVFLSPDYVSRVFRLETGIQLSEYIAKVRMAEACHLLESTDLPIGEIAYKTGFCDAAYFSKVFRIRNGVTPTQYQAEYLEKSKK